MAKIVFEGLDGYTAHLVKLSNNSHKMIRGALYEGVKIVCDAMRDEVDTIPTRKDAKHMVKVGLTEAQKQGLKDGVGITRHEDDQFGSNAKAGFVGYNSVITDKYPKGQPNALIARSICKGTSYLSRDAFVKRAVSKCKERSKQAMSDELIRRIEEVTKS